MFDPHRARLNRPAAVLPMPGISSQIHTRGGCGFSRLRIDDAGASSVCPQLFENIIATVGHGSSASSAASAADQLRPEVLTEKLVAALLEHPDLRPPGDDPEMLRHSAEKLRDLRAGATESLSRHFGEKVEETIRSGLTALSKALEEDFAARPREQAKAVPAIRNSLHAPSAAADDEVSFRKFEMAVAGLAVELSHRSQYAPENFERIRLRLISDITSSYSGALRALVASRVRDELKRQRTFLLQMWEEAARRGVDFEQRVHDATEQLRTANSSPSNLESKSIGRTWLRIDGPSEGEVLAALRRRTECEDDMELAQKICDQLIQRLRRVGRSRKPAVLDTDMPAFVLLKLDAETIAAELKSIVAESLRGSYSTYEIVMRQGEDRAARQLFERAAPTIDVEGRDRAQLGVTMTYLTIVSFPKPDTDRDKRCAERMRDAFRALAPCTFEELATADGEITVLRCAFGFPIGIEAQNRALLLRYAKAAARGHRPHLLGILPGSFAGQADPATLTIAQQYEL